MPKYEFDVKGKCCLKLLPPVSYARPQARELENKAVGDGRHLVYEYAIYLCLKLATFNHDCAIHLVNREICHS